MKEEQNKLERQLMEERQDIQRKQQEKVKLARTKWVHNHHVFFVSQDNLIIFFFQS